MIDVIKSYTDVRSYFTIGRIANQIHNNNSNLYKFFIPIQNTFDATINTINAHFIGIFPCKSSLLLAEHENELGIPDDIFDNTDEHYMFTYRFPIIFGIPPDTDPITDRTNDVIVKKYLMQNNSFDGYKSIAGQYDVALSVLIEEIVITTGFTYTFPIIFSSSPISTDCANAVGDCKFPLTFPILFGGCPNCVETAYGIDGEPILTITKITMYGATPLKFLKLSKIFEAIAPLGIKYEFINSDDDKPYITAKFCEAV